MEKKNIVILGIILFIAIIVGTLIFSSQSAPRAHDEIVVAPGDWIANPEGGLDPIKGWGSYTNPMVQSTLLVRDGHNLSNFKYDLAKNYSISEDRLTYTVNLRDDVEFHDGSKLTAKDVEFTFNTAQKAATTVDLTGMDSVRAIDDYTVEFKLKKPDSTFVNKFTMLGIVPSKSYDNKTYGSKPIGSGPYKLVEFKPGEQIILERNDNYYGTKPFFRKVTILALDEEATFNAARAGQIDVGKISQTKSKEKVDKMSIVSIESVESKGFVFPYVRDTGNVTEKGYKIGNNVTSDIAIRKALNYGVDRKALIDGPLFGQAKVDYTGSGNVPWDNPNIKIKDNDTEKAKQILEEAGWKDTDGDGIREKNGTKAEFDLYYTSNYADRQALSTAFAEQAEELGIKINIKGASFDEIETKMNSEAVNLNFGSYSPENEYMLYSSKTRGQGFENCEYYSNPVVDQYLEKAKESSSEAEAIPYYQKALWDGKTGASVLGDSPWVWIANAKYTYIIGDGIDIGKPTIQPHGGDILGNIVEWKRKNKS